MGKKAEQRFENLKSKEVVLNELFIDIYGMNRELAAEIDDKNVALRKADYSKDMKSLVSYIIGCALGRYNPEKEGLLYAGGQFAINRSYKFMPDEDNIIPVTDEVYLEDDIVGRICDFIKAYFGGETLEDNLQFIAEGLSKDVKASRQTIRDYIVNDFYGDHCSLYTSNVSGRRPIYWMFDSGKMNAFKALTYIHRINDETVGKIRVDYLHKVQNQIEAALHSKIYVRDNTSNNTEKSRATQLIEKYTKQLQEVSLYDRAIANIVNMHIHIDTKDGVKANYPKYQGVVIEEEGKKSKKINLLSEMK